MCVSRVCGDLQTFVGPPQALHAVPHEDDAGELCERLGDVEVAERAHLKESDAQLLGVHLRLLRSHLTLVGEVEAVPDQDLGHSRCMLDKKKREHWNMYGIFNRNHEIAPNRAPSDLVDLFDPPVDPIEGPAVGDVVHQDYSLQCAKLSFKFPQNVAKINNYESM